MALARHEFWVQDEFGNVITDAQVEVRREQPGQPLADLYSDRDGLEPMINPFPATGGVAAFHVKGGAYQIRVFKTGFERIARWVKIGTAAEHDVDEFQPSIEAVPVGEPEHADMFIFSDVSDDGVAKKSSISSLFSPGPINAMDFIPRSEWEAIEAGTSTMDVRAALNEAIAAAVAKRKRLYIPSGTYIVGGALVLQTESYLQGDGPDGTIIKLANGANDNVIWGGDADRWVLENFRIDGNRDNNNNGNGIQCTGSVKFQIDRVFIANCCLDGMDLAGPDADPLWGMEPTVRNVTVDNVGRHGIDYRGAHDGHFENIMIIDASQEQHNGYHGLYVGPGGNGRFFNVHSWHRASSTNRMSYACLVQNGGCDFVACHFEGAWEANLGIYAQDTTVTGCRIYAAWNGVNIVIRAPLNRVDAWVGPPGLGRPASSGVVLGWGAGDNVSACLITISGHSQENGFFDFNSDAGGNTIIARGYNSTGSPYLGVPHASDVCLIDITGPGGGSIHQNV